MILFCQSEQLHPDLSNFLLYIKHSMITPLSNGNRTECHDILQQNSYQMTLHNPQTIIFFKKVPFFFSFP